MPKTIQAMDTNYAEENQKVNGNSGHNSCNSDLQEDVSLLSQPLRTALTGFREAKRAYENGTDEVRAIIKVAFGVDYKLQESNRTPIIYDALFFF